VVNVVVTRVVDEVEAEVDEMAPGFQGGRGGRGGGRSEGPAVEEVLFVSLLSHVNESRID